MERPSIHIIAIAVMASSFALAHPARARTQTLHGECTYANRYQAVLQQPNHAVALCDAVTVDRGDHGAIQFTMGDPGSGGSWYRFDGHFSDDRMTVTRVQIHGKDPVAASGHCQVFERDGEISLVTCIARGGPLTYVGNFRPVHG